MGIRTKIVMRISDSSEDRGACHLFRPLRMSTRRSDSGSIVYGAVFGPLLDLATFNAAELHFKRLAR